MNLADQLQNVKECFNKSNLLFCSVWSTYCRKHYLFTFQFFFFMFGFVIGFGVYMYLISKASMWSVIILCLTFIITFIICNKQIRSVKQCNALCCIFHQQFSTRFLKGKVRLFKMVKMADKRLPKGYLYCTDKSSYGFHDRNLFFCRSFAYI